MLNKPTILAMTAAPLQEALEGYGVDFAALARGAGIDPTILAAPNARCPAEQIKKLWEAAAAACRDPLFGIRIGSKVRPGTFHALGLGIVSSTSVLDALQRIQRYSSVVSTNGRFTLTEENGLVGLETRPERMAVVPTIDYVDAMLVAVCRLLEQCAGPSAIPSKVVVMRPRTVSAVAYQEVLGCPIEFDPQRIAILFDAAAAARPVLSGNPELAAEADRLAARYIEAMAPDSTAARVKSLLVAAMPSGGTDQHGIARSLNQSASTLQRRLRKEGTSYQQLLDAARRELALEYLRQGRHSLADVAFLLGFADQSNFTRAFRRWTGRTPGEFLP